MIYFRSTFFFVFFLISLACSANDQTSESPETVPATESPGWFKKTLNNVTHTAENIYNNGRLSIILSGYAYHGRSTYTSERLDEFNEKAWGLGAGKDLRDEKDNEESLQFLILSDSHAKPQLNAVYSYQWMYPIVSNWEAGIGYTAGFFSRTDMYGGIPFPAILPLFTIGTRDTKLVMTYIPRLSGNKGNGDVLYMALKIGLD